MKKRKKRSVGKRMLDGARALLASVGDGAVNAMAQYALPVAGEVDNEKQRRTPLAYVHHQRALMKLKPKQLRDHPGRKEWCRYLAVMERNDPDAYAAYMLEVDAHIDAGELVAILPPELAEEAHQRAAVSGKAITDELVNAPYMGVLPGEIADARVNPDVDVFDASNDDVASDPYVQEMYAQDRAGETA